MGFPKGTSKSKVRYVDYRLTKSKTDRLIGEFIERPINGTVYAVNSISIKESVISKDKYKKKHGILYIEHNDGDNGICGCIYKNELEGQWIIHE